MYQPYILKYNYNALEPHISKITLETHYNSHYLKYLGKLNEILVKNNFKFQYPVKDLFENIDVFPIKDRDDILYNAGGVINHELYFDSMIPNGKIEIPEPLNSAIISKFGTINDFIRQFTDLANLLPGSGYTFLVVKPNKELYLINLANQDSPYNLGMVPILGIDVWEHAYYLDYRNNRKNYIGNFLEIINFDEVNRKYQQVLSNLE